MSLKNDNTQMSFRLPFIIREEISRTADKMNVTDSNFVRIAVQSAITKYMSRNIDNHRNGW